MGLQSDAQAEIFGAIKAAAAQSDIAEYGPAVRASVLRDLALAYRYASGGPQPGSVTVESK